MNRLRLFCTIYDASAGRYRFDYSIFIGFGIGFLVLASIGTILVKNIIRIMHDRHDPVS